MNKAKPKPKKVDKLTSRKEDHNVAELQVAAQEIPITSPSTTTTSQPLTSPTSSTVNRPSPTAWFTAEIQNMMYGFGDSRKPLIESAALIEQIVHHQMTTLLYQACDVANVRGGRFISIEDFLFLMRKDKVKLKRFLRYMTLKDLKYSAIKQQSMDEEESQEQIGADGKQPPKKKRKLCYDFLSSIDQTGELLALFEDDGIDDIKQDRLLRAEQSSRNMDHQQYLEFCEARQASFAPRYKSQKFKDWLMVGVNVEPKPNPLAIEVLCYMAYETVAEIVDLALLVRKDMQSTLEDPISVLLPGVCVNHENLQSAHTLQQHIQQQATANKSPSRAGSPSATPPSTPTTPSPMTSPTGGPGLGTTPPAASTTTSSSKSKSSKKRKKSGSSATKELNCGQSIQPSDITEVLRRYGNSIGPFAPFSKTPLMPAKQRLFCL